MTDFIGHNPAEGIAAMENMTPNSVQDCNRISDDITTIKNGIGSYTDILQDAMQALVLLQQRVRAHESHGGSIPVHSMQEVMDAVDVDYLADELPDALDAFEESLSRLETVQETIVTQQPRMRRSLPVGDGTVIQFPGRFR